MCTDCLVNSWTPSYHIFTVKGHVSRPTICLSLLSESELKMSNSVMIICSPNNNNMNILDAIKLLCPIGMQTYFWKWEVWPYPPHHLYFVFKNEFEAGYADSTATFYELSGFHGIVYSLTRMWYLLLRVENICSKILKIKKKKRFVHSGVTNDYVQIDEATILSSFQ